MQSHTNLRAFIDSCTNLSIIEDDIFKYSFESHVLQDFELTRDKPHRLLDTDNILYLPVGVPIKMVITSNDVLHSFSVPGLGIKVDALPGRLSNFLLIIDRPGRFYGQCSELCGPMHGFMPIVIDAIPAKNFARLIKALMITKSIEK
jgi:heme/copper-type cytochrome/quinol oxidase subunit 2